jgi:malate/lactate dehydrogenase
VLDESGLAEVVELDLDDREKADFEHSVAAVRADIQRLAELPPAGGA